MPTSRRIVHVVALSVAVLVVAAVSFWLLRDPEGPDAVSKPLQTWLSRGWKDWSPATWRSKPGDFYNPAIKGHWSSSRMSDSTDPNVSLDAGDPEPGASDPEPRPIPALPVATPYHSTAAVIGKVFFDSPNGPKVCTGTAVQDPAAPGKSNLVWTAGHCVHAGAGGGWYRNIVFVPSYNNDGSSGTAGNQAPLDEVAPYGTWWADWAETSPQWISEGSDTGGKGSAFDFAVLHVRPPSGDASLQETIGAAAPVRFDVPSAQSLLTASVWGYPAESPFDGETLFSCQDRPGRLSVDKDAPTMYRVGCTMTGGASGGGWFAPGPDGSLALVSDTSIGSTSHTWLAGPSLGKQAEKVYDAISRRFAGQKNGTGTPAS